MNTWRRGADNQAVRKHLPEPVDIAHGLNSQYWEFQKKLRQLRFELWAIEMRRDFWLSSKLIDILTSRLANLTDFVAGWVPLDEIPGRSTSKVENQLLFLGTGDQLLNEATNIIELHNAIGRHLNFAPSDWRRHRPFFEGFAGPFLEQFGHYPVMVQVVPRRKSFRSAVIGLQSKVSQRVMDTKFLTEIADLSSSNVTLSFNFNLPGRAFYAASLEEFSAKEDLSDKLYMTKASVRRTIPGTRENTEHWYFLARKRRDGIKIQRDGRIPVLEQYFREDELMQEAPIVRISAISPSGGWIQTHSFNVSPVSGHPLDMRQSRPGLEHFLRSGSHNLNALGRLLLGDSWVYRN